MQSREGLGLSRLPLQMGGGEVPFPGPYSPHLLVDPLLSFDKKSFMLTVWLL